MPRFSSSLISTADIGTWNYYIMSEPTPIWRSLNGLASWFNSQGGMLQGGAWLGALIALTMVIYGTAIGKKSVNAGVVATWFFFMCSMGITGTANVVNIYTGTITVVANVPALALVPASIFSKASYQVFKSMEAAFASTTGSYMSVSANGFVGPLDLLLTLRSDKFPAAHPALQRTLVQVVTDCSVDSNSTATATNTMKDTLDVLSWLKAYGRQSGITNVYSESDLSGKGEIYSCTDALIYLDNTYTALASGGSDMIKFLNANSKKINPSNASGNWGSSVISDSFGTLLGGIINVTQSSIQFTKNALVSSTVASTIDCVGNSGMMTSPDTCATSSLVLNDGKERWKTDAVLNGSGFIKVMFTSMGFLQVLFFALFPFIALYGLIVVNKTVQVFGGYILFGIWSQSWLLVVAPIQSYIQNSVIDELTRAIGNSQGMTMANQAAVYTILSDKLAVASDMMANSQMLSLALLSGSIYALSGLVGKSSGSQHMDSGLIQKKIADGSSLTSGGTSMNMNTMAKNDGSSVVVGAKPGASTVILGSSIVKSLGAVSSTDNSHSVSAEQSQSEDRIRQELTTWGLDKKESASIAKSISNTLGYQGSINSSMGSTFLKAIKSGAAKGSPPLSAKAEQEIGQMFSAANSTAVNTLAASDKGFWSKFNSNIPEERIQAREQAIDLGMDLLDAVGTGASLGSIGMTAGISTPAALAAMGSIRAMKGPATNALKSKFREDVKTEAKDATKSAAGTAARGTLRNLTSGFGEVVAGGIGAVATAAHQEMTKKDNGVSASRALTRNSNDSAAIGAALRKSFGDSFKSGYSESAGQSNVQTNAVSMDMTALTRSVENGDVRAALALTKSVLATNGQYSASQIKAAEMKTKDTMSGYVYASTTPGVSSEDVRTGVYNALFQQNLTGQVQTSLDSPNPHAAGSDLLQATPQLKTPDAPPSFSSSSKVKPTKVNSGKTGSTEIKNKPFLVNARNGEVQNVASEKTIAQKTDDVIDSVKGLFTGESKGEQKAMSEAPVGKETNPNKRQGGKGVGASTSTVPAKSTVSRPSSPVAPVVEPLDASNPANYVFHQQPATKFKSLPSLVNQTSSDRENIINRGAPTIKRVIDNASIKQESELAKSANPNAILGNWKLAGQYADDAANQQTLVNEAIIAAAVVGVGAAVIASAAEIFGGGAGSGNAKPATASGNTSSSTGSAGATAAGSNGTSPPTRTPVNSRTVANRTTRFGKNR